MEKIAPYRIEDMLMISEYLKRNLQNSPFCRAVTQPHTTSQKIKMLQSRQTSGFFSFYGILHFKLHFTDFQPNYCVFKKIKPRKMGRFNGIC